MKPDVPTVIWLIAFAVGYFQAMNPKTPKILLPGIFKKLLAEGKIKFPSPAEQQKALDQFADHSFMDAEARKAQQAFEFIFGQCRDLKVDEVLALPDPISAFDYMMAHGYKLDMITGRYYGP